MFQSIQVFRMRENQPTGAKLSIFEGKKLYLRGFKQFLKERKWK